MFQCSTLILPPVKCLRIDQIIDLKHLIPEKSIRVSNFVELEGSRFLLEKNRDGGEDEVLNTPQT
jgi:hypothetical protein